MATLATVGTSTRRDPRADREELRDALAAPGSDGPALLRRLVAADNAITADAERRRAAELEDLVAVGEAMRRLRQCGTPDELIEAAPAALAEVGGFTRTMISRVHGSKWMPVRLVVRDGIDPEEDAFRAFVERHHIPLRHLLLEGDLVRRRVPALVTDAPNSPRTFGPLVEVSRSTSYVVAPIVPTGRVIGFLHADRFGDRICDERDRDLVWAFAEHFGLLFERAVLLERLEHQRRRLRAALDDAVAAIEEINEAELMLASRGPLAEPPAAARRRAGTSRVDALLTPREREVLDMLASGATNTQIAHRLVLSPGTVKSHLKRIMRKLHVTNRAEAVAKYLHLIRCDEEAGR